VLCQSECACLHKIVNMVVFFIQLMKIRTQKGEHSSKYTELSLKWKDAIYEVLASHLREKVKLNL